MRGTALVMMLVMARAGYGDLTPTASYPPTPLPPREGGKATAAALPATVVTLKAEVEVRGEAVRVADVATLEGSAEAKARIGEVVVGPSPLPGDVRMISAGYVKLRLRKAGIGDEEVKVEGEGVKVKGTATASYPPTPLPRREGGTATSSPGPLSTEWRGGDTARAQGVPVMKRGEAVEVWVCAGGITVKTAGRAAGDGAVGEAVSVRIEQTQTLVSGVVVGKGICEVRM